MSTLSVITPAFNASGHLAGLYERLTAILGRDGSDWEWIVVDDHSTDGTPQAVAALAARDPRVRGVRLSRRHGADAAIVCGLDESTGAGVVVMAGGAQTAPDALPELIQRWRGGAQVVWAVPSGGARPADPVTKVHDSFLRQVGVTDAAVAARLFLVDRSVVAATRTFRDQRVSVGALIGWLGFRQEVVADAAGVVPGAVVAPMGLTTKLDRLSAVLTTFSDLPIRIGTGVGLLVLGFGLLCFVLAFLGVEVGNLSPGWILLLSGILIAGGLNLCFLGVIGEYLWRTLEESRPRPRYVVEARVDGRATAAIK